jgi:hypothetical protein
MILRTPFVQEGFLVYTEAGQIAAGFKLSGWYWRYYISGICDG